jgi:hypothetical protein
MEPLDIVKLVGAAVMRDQTLSCIFRFVRIEVCGISGIGSVCDDVLQVSDQ